MQRIRLSHAGYYYDEETGLYYCQSRYYIPTLGRFLTKDGYGYIKYTNPQTLNLYAYCNNNPVSNVDPTGHFIVAAIPLVIEGAGYLYALLTLGATALVVNDTINNKPTVLEAKKTAPPSKLVDKEKGTVKTPDTNPDEFTEKNGIYTHKDTGWTYKKDKSGHRGEHYDAQPKNGKYGDYQNVFLDGKIL